MKWAILSLISIFIAFTAFRMIGWNDSGDLMAYSYSVWGDWSAHFTFITAIRERGLDVLLGDNPLFAGVPFQYPFLSHLLTALFGILTFTSTITATTVSSLILLALLPWVLYSFMKAIGLHTRASMIAVILFLFLGGLQIFDPSLSINEPLTNQFKSASVFTQLLWFELIPQRAFLFGLLIFLSTITVLIRKLQQPPAVTKSFFIITAMALALLSWTHLHSWMAMGALLLVVWAMTTRSIPFRRKQVFIFGTTIAVISAPLLYFLLLRSNAGSAGMHWNIWNPGWAQNPSTNLGAAEELTLIGFWIYNTGIFLPLAMIGAFLSRKNKEIPLIRILFVCGAILFAIAETINLQPYFYDNLKLFTYAFLFMAPMAAIAVDRCFHKKSFAILGVAVLILQSATAVSDGMFYIQHQHSTVFFSHHEIEIADQFKTLRRSPDSLVLIAPKHNHWLTALTGNPVLMGYPGWLWSWGISYRSRELEVREMLTGGPQAMALISKYHIEYIAVHEQDRIENHPIHIDALKSNFKTVISANGWWVFDTSLKLDPANGKL
jgi:hypothetical protein